MPQWCQNDTKTIPEWFQHDAKMVPTWCQNDPKMKPKWFQNNVKIMPTWSQTDPKVIQKSESLKKKCLFILIDWSRCADKFAVGISLWDEFYVEFEHVLSFILKTIIMSVKGSSFTNPTSFYIICGTYVNYRRAVWLFVRGVGGSYRHAIPLHM